jgi:hypothetical protein
MYPYTQNTGSLIAIIKAIGSHGVPDKFTTKELPVWGYKSSNDRAVVSVLKFIGFIDSSGTPTQLWRDARTQPEEAAAAGTRLGYSDLFKTFPNAHQKDGEALTNFFKAKTTVGDAAVKLMVATFRALAQYGNFSATSEEIGHKDGAENASPFASQHLPEVKHVISSGNGVTINLNIELAIPTDATGEVYEKFFAAMRKHIIDGGK